MNVNNKYPIQLFVPPSDYIFAYIYLQNVQIENEYIRSSFPHVSGSANSCFSENEFFRTWF